MSAETPHLDLETLPSISIESLIKEFGLKYPTEMQILRIAGVYPGEYAGEFVNPYSGEKDSEYFGNVGEHTLNVAKVAGITIDHLPNATQYKAVTEQRAILHDVLKRLEILRRNAAEKNKDLDVYTPKAYETVYPFLHEAKVDPQIIAYMMDAGGETGHNSLVRFIQLDSENNPVLNLERTIPEMVVHVADDMTFTPIVQAGEQAKTLYLTTSERMSASDFPNRYPILYTQGFGFTDQGEHVLLNFSDKHPETEKFKKAKEWEQWFDELQTQDVSLLRYERWQDYTTELLKTENPQLLHVHSYAEWQPWVSTQITKHLFEQKWNIPAQGIDTDTYFKDLVNATLVGET